MKRLCFLPILSLLTLFTVISACSDDDKTGQTYNPVIKITSVTPADSSVNFTYETNDAERAAFMIYGSDQQPIAGASEILSQGTKLNLDETTYYGTRKSLLPNTNYVLVAVAGKGNSISEIVKQTFKTQPAPIRKTFLSAIGSFENRNIETGTAIYTIDFSTDEFSTDGSTEHFPTSHLYVTLTGDANTVDLASLSIPTGTYTLGDSNAPVVGKFYAGDIQNGEPFNTFLTTQEEKNGDTTTNLISNGTLTITAAEGKGKYKVELNFVDENGGKIEGTYEGSIAMNNNSEELPPSEELPLPESTLTNDITLTIAEAYYSDFGTDRYGYKGRKEMYLQLYTSSNYDEYIDLYLLTDNTKYENQILPVGIYPLYKWNEFTTPGLSAISGFHVKSSSVPDTWMGCNYAYESGTHHVALTDGEVEIISYDTSTGEVSLKFTLKDNAAQPHTVSGSYKGSIIKL